MAEHGLTNGSILVVYKDEGMTSHDVVDVIRRCTGQKRVGHGGTLDLCAKGVLVIGIGRAATRTLASVVAKEKEYVVRIKLGWRSTTEDREGDKTQVHVGQIPSEDQIRQALKGFEGNINQHPPIFSAVKVRGRVAYKAARAKKPLALAVRQVEARQIELLAYAWPYLSLRLVTSPGFYVRSLARDLGDSLGTGGYVEELERTRVGTFTKDQALRLADLKRSYSKP